MRLRHILILFILFFSFRGTAQPSETTYLGTVIKSGYSDDESFGPFDIGFNFTFFGNSYNQFYVNSNGLVLFGAGSTDGTEDPIPTAAAPNNFIAPLWDNLIISSSGKMLYATIGSAPTRKLIIQGTNMGFYPAPIFMGTYLVILYETSNIIQVQYRIIIDATSTRAHGSSATIGLENTDGTAGVQYAYHNPTAIYTGQAISFTPSGPTYTINSNEVYDGVVLTTNLTLPEPGIPQLISPPQDAVIGSDYTFEWAESGNAATYTLLISYFSDIGGATSYSAGTNLTYDITGLTLDTTYYWGVFATNATGTTWCEIKRFTTTSVPPIAAVPQTIFVEQSQEKTIKLQYTGGDASTKTAIVTSLPAQGQLYQYNAGVKGALISSVPTTVTDGERNVIYLANGTTGNSVGNFSYIIHDDTGDSPSALVTVNVSPPGIPNLLYAAKNANVELQFDRPMADPAGKQSQFTVTVNSSPATINSLSLKPGDPYSIIVTLNTPLTGTETVLISYTAGDVVSVQGGWLLSFTDQSVTLTAQTITFSQSLSKKYSDSPLTLTATASSGLGMTYSSSNMGVATASSNILTFHALGTSDITARQLGNGTYAPARYIKTLTVDKGDQTITFNVLPVKTYGDADFSPGATASSGLTVSYSSDNTGVATIVGSLIHIVGAGTAVITASQAGNSLWNPAVSVPQTLNVSKASQTITFAALPVKTYGDSDFNPGATASSGLTVSYASGNTGVATIVGGMIHIVGGGTAVITASQAGNSNYNPATDVPQTLTVNKTDLTFTADNKTKVYLEANPTLTFTISGFVNGETQSVLDNLPSVQTTALQASPVGEYPITVTGGSDNSYLYIYIAGTLTITKFQQTITFTDVPEKLLVGDTYTLAATSSAGLTVSFESMDEDIATVSGTELTGVAKGIVQIRAFNAGDENYDAAEALADVEVYSTHKDIMYLFTPNNDSFNDLWELPEMNTWGNCDVKVYNRWGKLVYDNKNYNNTWDGTSGGKPVPEGAYYFVIKTENSGVVKGTVNIVR